MALSGSSIVIVFIGVVAYAVAGPIQLQAGQNTLQQNEYGGLADLLARYMEGQSMGSYNIDGIGYPLRLGHHKGFDSLSGTFGQSKRFIPFRRPSVMNVRPGNFDEIDRSVFDHFSKRNIDEIDTAFDSLFKRNFDEIDRAGWGGFVKRLNNYLADRQQR
ncbi:PREDICTED: orcokinin peptides type A-like isoform X2 [Atta colombica]|nr:PREDICTED: orcokinin peptides type A-like isoform X2 [Atta colombica]